MRRSSATIIWTLSRSEAGEFFKGVAEMLSAPPKFSRMLFNSNCKDLLCPDRRNETFSESWETLKRSRLFLILIPGVAARVSKKFLSALSPSFLRVTSKTYSSGSKIDSRKVQNIESIPFIKVPILSAFNSISCMAKVNFLISSHRLTKPPLFSGHA